MSIVPGLVPLCRMCEHILGGFAVCTDCDTYSRKNGVNMSLTAAVRGWLAVCVMLSSLVPWGVLAAADSLDVPILYFEQQVVRPPVLSNLVVIPEDEGLSGATLGIEDNNTTGKFLQHAYTLDTQVLEPGADTLAAAREALGGGAHLVVLNVPTDLVAAIADLDEAADDVLFNVGSHATDLRAAQCRSNVLHTLPSHAMLTDGLMQFFAKKRWSELFLVAGNRPGDTLYADSLRRSARKFGLTFTSDKRWLADTDIRRNAAVEVPAFTQGSDYDAVVVADEADDFGQYIMYNTWLPRPVAGTVGIEPVAWHAVVEQWGAAQLQSRFRDTAERSMRSIDYAAWAAVRSIGEAVTRTKSTDTASLRNYIVSDAFSLAGFKGVKMNYRPWNGQLRQPIPMVHPQAVIAVAPIEGFLHQQTELDTLGLDEPEAKCSAFN